MQLTATPAATPLLAHLTHAFAAWETNYRADPDTFMTPAETAAMAVATVSEQRAIYFTALLRQAHATPVIAMPAVGDLWPEQGGHLGAILGAGADAVAVIVIDRLHEITGQWGTYGLDVPNACSRTDGLANTVAMAEAGSAIALQARALRAGGKDDWHIPARDIARALADQAPQLFDHSPWYWTSTQDDSHGAYAQGFAYGNSYWSDKDDELRVRAVRTIQLQSLTTSPLPAEGEAVAAAPEAA
ncbi:MAG: hypothetical protein AB7P37_03345 [Ramlibacter sp.]